MISPSQRPLPDNTQHSQQTNIHAPGGIRTHDRSRRAAVDLRLRPRSYWVLPVLPLKIRKHNSLFYIYVYIRKSECKVSYFISKKISPTASCDSCYLCKCRACSLVRTIHPLPSFSWRIVTMLKKVDKEGSGVCIWLFLENSLPTRGRTPWTVNVCDRKKIHHRNFPIPKQQRNSRR